jgi:hypothetical protein
MDPYNESNKNLAETPAPEGATGEASPSDRADAPRKRSRSRKIVIGVALLAVAGAGIGTQYRSEIEDSYARWRGTETLAAQGSAEKDEPDGAGIDWLSLTGLQEGEDPETDPLVPQEEASPDEALPAEDDPQPLDPPVQMPPTMAGRPQPGGFIPIAPANPFDGPMMVMGLPTELRERIAGDPQALRNPGLPGNRDPEATTRAEPAPTAAGADRVLVTLDQRVGAGAESARSELAAMAKALGGSSQVFNEYRDIDRSDTPGILLFIPEAQLDEVVERVAAVGSTLVRDRWKGSSSARQSRLQDSYRTRIADLRKQRVELLGKYFEDAPTIVHMDEDIDRLTKTLNELKVGRSAEGMAIIKVSLLR